MSLGLEWGRSSGSAWRTREARSGRARCPTAHPFPFGRGRNGSALPARASSAPGLGEGRRGRRDLHWLRSVGSQTDGRRGGGGGWGDWAFCGLSAGRVEFGVWQPCRFACLLSPVCTEIRPLLGGSPSSWERARALSSCGTPGS